jgi:hypothetical protein
MENFKEEVEYTINDCGIDIHKPNCWVLDCDFNRLHDGI